MVSAPRLDTRKDIFEMCANYTTDNTPPDGIEPGYCWCGCGQQTPIAKNNCAKRGHIKGQPTRFIRFHHLKIINNRERPSLAERFWEKVEIRKPEECWPWTGSLNRFGYGQININDKPHLAHRVSYTLTHGEIPDGMCILHKCDFPKCVNPNHLFVGTKADNTADMMSKGRHKLGEIRRGENSSNFIMTTKEIYECRALWESGEWTQVSLAKRYGVHPATISGIINKRNRKDG